MTANECVVYDGDVENKINSKSSPIVVVANCVVFCSESILLLRSPRIAAIIAAVSKSSRLLALTLHLLLHAWRWRLSVCCRHSGAAKTKERHADKQTCCDVEWSSFRFSVVERRSARDLCILSSTSTLLTPHPIQYTPRP